MCHCRVPVHEDAIESLVMFQDRSKAAQGCTIGDSKEGREGLKKGCGKDFLALHGSNNEVQKGRIYRQPVVF